MSLKTAMTLTVKHHAMICRGAADDWFEVQDFPAIEELFAWVPEGKRARVVLTVELIGEMEDET